MNVDAIPQELRDRPQWVIWKFEPDKDGKPTKVPYGITGAKAKTNKPETWGSFGDARQALATLPDRYEGLGYVFSVDDPYTGIDFDDCLDGDDLHKTVREHLLTLDSYTEVSPSKTGVKTIVRAAKNGYKRCNTEDTPWRGKFEAYDERRFFTVTGNVWNDSTLIADRQEGLDAVLEALLPNPAATTNGSVPSPAWGIAIDDELLARARSASNGDLFSRLYDQGDTTGHNEDDSSADLALCNMLAYYAGRDPDRIDELFRSSGLMRPKWDERRGDSTYGRRTIDTALEGRTEFHAPANGSAASSTADSEPIEIVTLEDFTAVKEPGAEPLVGNGPDDVLIPEGGDVMFYGDGGSSKTTLGIDLAMHAAGGDTWLGNEISRPLSVLLIENEGPRPLFQAKLERKLQAWTGAPIKGRVHIYRGPWGKLSFADTEKRQQLADAIREHEIDLVVAGPLTRLGMDEAGTLQQVRDFMGLVANVRELSQRRVAILLIHHENKGGKVSGAWEGSGDTLIHTEVHGNGYTKLSFQKARWSSNLHGSDLKLRWTDGEGFEVEETRERDLYHEMPSALREDLESKDEKASGQRVWSAWKTAGELSKFLKANKDTCREVADDLVDRGELEYQEGPEGRSKQAHCWRLRTGSEPPSHPEPVGDLS
jgi:putative DNA primase/helicase